MISFCVRAQVAVNSVVRAPKHRQILWAVGLLLRRGLRRISRKTPATTIVLECSRAETGVGPSMAEGSQGCRPNCADFPAAAKMRPIRGSVRSLPWASEKICWISHELRVRASHATAKTRPISPTRL